MLVDTNLIGTVSYRISEGGGQESSTDPKALRGKLCRIRILRKMIGLSGQG